MSDKPKRFEIEKNLFAVDSSGSAPDGARMKRQADRVFTEIEKDFKPSKLRRMDEKAAASGS